MSAAGSHSNIAPRAAARRRNPTGGKTMRHGGAVAADGRERMKQIARRMTRRDWLLGWSALPAVRGSALAEFVCPMDPDIRAVKAGRCPRCGMTLVEGVPDGAEYPVSLRLRPAAPRPG